MQKMKFRIYPIFIFSLCLLLPSSIKALSPAEILNRESECTSIELAEAKEDGSLTKVECFDSYQDAKNSMNNSSIDNLVILENRVIIDAKYAVIDYDIDYPSWHRGYILLYTSSTNNIEAAYIRGGTPDEAAMIDFDYNTKRVKIKVAGITGWINKYDDSLKLYDIIPISWVKTFQYYKVGNDTLTHYLPGNVYGTKGQYAINIDKKPSMLNDGIYYSYDGNYFYTSMKTLLQDYKNDNYNQAINKDNPYYNYYQYLAFRTKTNYSSENIDQYISLRTSSGSKMLTTGSLFINAQDTYGTNAILMMAIGMNESDRGRSPYAQNRNNLFGLNAVDKNPSNASYYDSIEDCINTYSYAWLSYGFLDPRDYRYFGGNLGNKYQGLNYKYASDPFWAEKAASYYYDIDKMFGFQDRNSYKTAVLNNEYNNTVFAYKTPGGEIVKDYQYKKKNASIVILEEVEGQTVNGTNIWYKIQSDGMLNDNLDIIGSSKDNPRVTYNWEKNVVYVSKSYFKKIDEQNSETPVNPSNPSTPNEEEKPTPKKVSLIVTEASYEYKDGYISKISPGTSVETIKNNLTNTGGVITITDSNGNTKESGNIATGNRINITSGVTETLIVLIYGDINGDGNISAVDYVNVKNHIMGSNTLNDFQAKAADVNGDGNISAVDYVNIKNYIMGSENVIKN